MLLKNEKDFLPLDKKSIKSIAVIGPLADSVHWDWYGGTPPYKVTPLDGIKAEAGPGVKINYAASELGNAAVNAARESDVAVVIVGNDLTCGPDMPHDWYSTSEGGGFTLPCTVPSDGREGRDRERIGLDQEQLVKQVYEVNRKTIVILVSSFRLPSIGPRPTSPPSCTWPTPLRMKAQPSPRSSSASTTPEGHLVATWPKSIDQLPPMMDYNIRHGRTYMYFKGEPLYPFGYGLSYTTFKYSNLRAARPISPKTAPSPSASMVTNTGARAGDAVVQLYVKHLQSKVERPRQELKGFERVTIQPNQTRTVQIRSKPQPSPGGTSNSPASKSSPSPSA